MHLHQSHVKYQHTCSGLGGIVAIIQSAQDAICYARLCVTMERYHIEANMFYSFTDVLILKYS